MANATFVRRLSPRHRRWERLQRSLDLDPAAVDGLEPPGPRDFLICGPSRSGTSLLSAALYQPPVCVTVMEPWDAMRQPPAKLFSSLRAEIAEGTIHRGRLDVGALERSGEVRWGPDGRFPHAVEAPAGHLLGVKLPVFWRYLDLLPGTKFLVCLRHPMEVIESFAKTGGRLAEGLDYESAFNREMNGALRAATDDRTLRRALLLEYVASRLVPHLADPNVFVVRYERWFSDRDGLMREIGRFLGRELGPGLPVVRLPKPVRPDPAVLRMLEEHCPSVAALGYDLRIPAR